MELKDILPFLDPEILKRWTEYQQTRDWNLVDWTQPKTFNDLANVVRNSGLGGDVREALAKMFEEVSVMVGAGANEEQARQILDLIGSVSRNSKTAMSTISNRLDSIIANAGDGTIPTELIDIRTLTDGTTYQTAGSAVRKVDSKLTATLEKNKLPLPNFNDGNFVEYTTGKVGTIADVDVVTATESLIDISRYNKIMISGFNYTADNNSGLAFYDIAFNFISGFKYSEFKDKALLRPSNAKYIKFSIPTASKGTVVLYGFVNESKMMEKVNDSLPNKRDTVTEFNASFIEKSKNLFDQTTAKQGFYIQNDTGREIANTDFYASDFIPITGGVGLVKNFINQGAFYDNNKNFISGFVGFSSSTTPAEQQIQVPLSARFLRISIHKSQLPLTQLEEGTTMTPYTPYGNYIKPSLISKYFSNATLVLSNISSLLVNATTKVKIKLIGDSITHGVGGTGFAQDGALIVTGGRWNINTQGYCWANLLKADLEARFNCEVANFGMSGAASGDIVANLNELITDEDDIVIMQIGTNNRGEGATQRFASLAGDLETIHQHCLAKGVKLIPMIAPPASVTNENIKDEHMEDVAHVISAFANKNNLEVINNFRMFSERCEMRDETIDTYLMDGLHPNDEGYEVMYRHISRELGIAPKIKEATW